MATHPSFACSRWCPTDARGKIDAFVHGAADRPGGGLFAGTPSGATVIAALCVAGKLGPGATVVTLIVDSGLKYVNTDVYGRNPV